MPAEIDGRLPDAIFAKIARRYDSVNKILSFGQDQAWRARTVAYLPPGRILDLGSGTGAASSVFGSREVVALDPVSQMLAINPIRRRVVALGEALPFADATFDAVFSAYVFRNLDSVCQTLGEVARVLRPGGAAGIVDLGRPKRKISARLHRAASSLVLPTVGRSVGAAEEYRYLARSLDKLPPPEALYAGGPLRFERVWRMGPLGFVYGVVLRKEYD